MNPVPGASYQEASPVWVCPVPALLPSKRRAAIAGHITRRETKLRRTTFPFTTLTR